MHEMIQPEGWQRPSGYNNGVAAQGRVVFVAGQIGWNERCEFVSDEFAAQAAQALRNVVAVVNAAGGDAQHITRLTWYVTDKRDYINALREIGDAYRVIVGRNYPAMTLVQVGALLEDRAKVEIEATAVIP